MRLLIFILFFPVLAQGQRITVPVVGGEPSIVLAGLPVGLGPQDYTVIALSDEVMTDWTYDRDVFYGFAVDTISGIITYTEQDSSVCNLSWGGTWSHSANNTTIESTLQTDEGGTGSWVTSPIGQIMLPRLGAGLPGSGSSSIWSAFGAGDRFRLVSACSNGGTLTAESYYISIFCLD
jgi:hypothetical protein